MDIRKIMHYDEDALVIQEGGPLALNYDQVDHYFLSEDFVVVDIRGSQTYPTEDGWLHVSFRHESQFRKKFKKEMRKRKGDKEKTYSIIIMSQQHQNVANAIRALYPLAKSKDERKDIWIFVIWPYYNVRDLI